jgi:hypothetical protein
MQHQPQSQSSVQNVSTFQDLISTPFQGTTNAISWSRELEGDFEEIVNAIHFEGNMVEVDVEDLLDLELSGAGKVARETILSDFRLLSEFGASPVLNIISNYEVDEHTFFPTDVYSFHVDRSPIATDTFLCTYYGDASDILPNEFAKQKIWIPEIRKKLRDEFTGEEADFENYLIENFYDLHYEAIAEGKEINLSIGNLWRLAVDHPNSKVLPCVHRAPKETSGRKRLLLIC